MMFFGFFTSWSFEASFHFLVAQLFCVRLDFFLNVFFQIVAASTYPTLDLEHVGWNKYVKHLTEVHKDETGFMCSLAVLNFKSMQLCSSQGLY